MSIFSIIIEDLATNLFGGDPFVEDMRSFFRSFDSHIKSELKIHSLPSLRIKPIPQYGASPVVGSYLPDYQEVVIDPLCLEYIDELKHDYFTDLTTNQKRLFVYVHELVHHRQYVTGKLKSYDNFWCFDGKMFPTKQIFSFSSSSNKVYNSWPWEVEANREALRIVKRLGI